MHPELIGATTAVPRAQSTLGTWSRVTRSNFWICFVVLLLGLTVAGCRTARLPGTIAPRDGDEILVAGQLVHTGTPVVLWLDPGGYDAYRVERRFSPLDQSDWETSKTQVRALTTPNRYGLRRSVLTDAQAEEVRGGGWDLTLLQSVVDQFVIHFDASGTSQRCFETLHDRRGLSVHFMLDLDGTIYQTLDLKERAWHATTSNGRSVGIEIANVGAFPASEADTLPPGFSRDPDGRVRMTAPGQSLDARQRTPNFIARPSRPDPISGTIQGKDWLQYDFTPEQYRALIRLTAALCRVLPKIRCDFPRDPAGQVIPHKLPDDVLTDFQGLIGHYHIQTNKIDPGPAFQWDYVTSEANKLLRQSGAPSFDRPAQRPRSRPRPR